MFDELALNPKTERFVLRTLAWIARKRAKWMAIETALAEAERRGVNTKPTGLKQTMKMMEEIGKLEKEGLEKVFKEAYKEALERETKNTCRKIRTHGFRPELRIVKSQRVSF